MIIFGVTQEQVSEAAGTVGARLADVGSKTTKKYGIGVKCVIRPVSGEEGERYRKTGRDGRRVNAITWEGHREFMRYIYRLEPDARIVSCAATYTSASQFEATHRNSATKGFG